MKDEVLSAACRSIGTKQCAAICLSSSSNIELGNCPHRSDVWNDLTIRNEYRRRPTGPLQPYIATEAHAGYGINDTWPGDVL